MQDPYIFADGLEQARNDVPTFSNTCKRRFGEAASCLMRGYREWPVCAKPLTVWQSSLASEALLFPPERREQPPFIGFLSSECKPIGSTMPDYGTLFTFPSAAALFPMAGRRAQTPQFGRIWVFGKDDTGKLPPESHFPLEDSGDMLGLAEQQGVRLYAEIGDAEGCDGKSWQLAAALAMDALCEEDFDYRIRLASEWIVTGELDQSGCIRKVDIGNKVALGTDCERTWLIPQDSQTRFDAEILKSGTGEVHYYSVRTLEEAYSHLKEIRIVRKPCELWPRPTFNEQLILHTLLTREPHTILAIPGNCNPAELHLWPMDAMEQAHLLKIELSAKYPRTPIVIHEGLLSDETDQVLTRLREALRSAIPVTCQFFDISDGTYLVQSMITALAKSMGFKIICRDTSDHPFIKVWYHRHTQHFCELIPRKPLSKKRPPVIPPTMSNDEI